LLLAKTSVRYGAAIAASLIGLGVASLPLGFPSAYVPAFIAVIFSAAWAGPGPGLVATAIAATGGCLIGLHNGRPPQMVLLGLALFLAEGILLCIGSARLARFAKKASASDARHRNLLETASEGIWLHDASSVITYGNARIAEMLGVVADKLVGRRVDEFYFPADVSMERSRTEALSRAGGNNALKQQFDRRLRRTDGSEMWVLACSNAVDGEPGVLSMMTDITERKRAEQALRKSEQRYRDLFDGVLEGIYQSAPDGRITAANHTLLKMLGYQRESDLRDMDVARDLYAEPGLRRKLLAQLEREGTLQNVEYELRTADGNILRVMENARVIRGEHGEVTGFEGTLSDITAKKRGEEQLKEAQKLEALGRLAGGVARDFDGVLNLIAVHVEATLQQLPSGHPAHTQVELARDAAKSGMALTRQLLSFSRKPRDPEHHNVAVIGEDESPATADGGETILLVESDPLVRELSRDMLERQGYRVILALEAAEAERISARSRFDLLIVAVSAQELAHRIRSIHPELHVLFVTGYEKNPTPESPPNLPGLGYIEKPFSADSLSRKIRLLLSPQS
jgi:PAS domain S-box-containing protein